MDRYPLVSVIVPVYNCEKFIARCFDSLKAQSYVNCQFIVVDDGSTDGGAELMDGYAAADNRFTVIHQTNGGVAAARNRALAVAEGDYIAFVDADDYVAGNFVEAMVFAALETGAELVMCGYNKVYDDRIDENALPLAGGKLTDSREIWLECAARSPELWNKLFSRSLIQRAGVSFRMRTGEDYLFNTRLAPFVQKAVTISIPLYYYVQRADSLMRSGKKADNTYTFVNAFLDWQANDRVYIKFGQDAYELLCAYAFTAMLHSAEAIGRGANFYRGQLELLGSWEGYDGFRRGMADGTIMAKLAANGSVGQKLSLAFRGVFSLGGLGTALLPALNRMIVKQKRENGGTQPNEPKGLHMV